MRLRLPQSRPAVQRVGEGVRLIQHLLITIPDHNAFYSLYADGPHVWKTYDQAGKTTTLCYPPGSAVALYYTYPNHREACVIRNLPDVSGAVPLPGLSRRVSILCGVRASKVDKLRRAVGFLRARGIAFALPDGFYIRLRFILDQRGPLNYTALRKLAAELP